MKVKMSVQQFDSLLDNIKNDYKVVAPVKIPYSGTYSDTDVIRYEEINSIKEVEFGEKSHFTAKEVVMPVTETLFYFNEDNYKIASIDERKILVFMRACDIHGLDRIDRVYLQNGPEPDFFYKRLREKVKIVVMECEESFRNCFCVSFNTNKTDNYSLGIKVDKGDVYIDIKDDEFKEIFKGEKADFNIDFVESNGVTVKLPEKMNTLKVEQAEFWREYDGRCIACGRCNFSCPTCSCFTMQDVISRENPKSGERRRVGASCQVPGFSTMAGGHDVREKNGDKMRFRTLHKMYDYAQRFGPQMCVGCGRCDDVCPQYISLSTAMNKVTKYVEDIAGEER
ncbi:anaerobic sulfite reductase subunit AsrA [Clostridium sp.]|uniref:anaerobic sulfite reductase subunit AsrA n=1 Tax=Clostridium sp. TaxID=1506 RepID=UPI003F375C99